MIKSIPVPIPVKKYFYIKSIYFGRLPMDLAFFFKKPILHRQPKTAKIVPMIFKNATEIVKCHRWVLIYIFKATFEPFFS